MYLLLRSLVWVNIIRWCSVTVKQCRHVTKYIYFVTLLE